MLNKSETDKSGFGALGTITIILVIVVLGTAGWFIYKNYYKTSTTSTSGSQNITDGSVSVGLKLNEHKATLGSTITGTINIMDKTVKSLNTNLCPGDIPPLGLQNGKFKFTAIETTQACYPTIDLHPGNNFFNIQINTSACNYAAAQPNNSELSKYKCTPTHNSNLPSGVYKVAIWLYGIQGVKYNTVIAPEEVTLIPT